MDPYKRLLGSAQQEVAGLDANRVLFEQREALTERHGRSVGYEIMLAGPPMPAWEGFVETTLGRLFEHLKAKRETFPWGPHILTPIWHGDTLYLLDAPTLFRVIAEIEGTTEPELRARMLGWARELAGAKPSARLQLTGPEPPLLPAPVALPPGPNLPADDTE